MLTSTFVLFLVAHMNLTRNLDADKSLHFLFLTLQHLLLRTQFPKHLPHWNCLWLKSTWALFVLRNRHPHHLTNLIRSMNRSLTFPFLNSIMSKSSTQASFGGLSWWSLRHKSSRTKLSMISRESEMLLSRSTMHSFPDMINWMKRRRKRRHWHSKTFIESSVTRNKFNFLFDLNRKRIFRVWSSFVFELNRTGF